MKSAILGIVGMLSIAAAANAQIWAEIGDAPALPHASGQITVGVGPLMMITGGGEFDAAGSIDADMYCVRVDGQFLASTVGLATWDTMLALYDSTGTTQLFLNDDAVGLQSTISGSVPAGIYQLGITRFPDFSFTGAGVGATPYGIRLEGFTFCEVPAPSAAALLGLGGLVATRRRR